MGEVSRNNLHHHATTTSPDIVELVDKLRQGAMLVAAARSLIQGGFSMKKIDDAKHFITSAQSFFKGFSHHNRPEGLGEETFVEDWKHESKDVWMFSGERTPLA